MPRMSDGGSHEFGAYIACMTAAKLSGWMNARCVNSRRGWGCQCLLYPAESWYIELRRLHVEGSKQRREYRQAKQRH